MGRRILNALERRLDPETGRVKPDWKGLARERGVSRSTIARQMVGLRQSGAVESVYVKVVYHVVWNGADGLRLSRYARLFHVVGPWSRMGWWNEALLPRWG